MIIKSILFTHTFEFLLILFHSFNINSCLGSKERKHHTYSLFLKYGHKENLPVLFFQHQEDSTMAFFLILSLKRHLEEV